ncbi:glycosyltransferase family 1 protein [bacterium]|nr:MAG: glycosyltransferase family 1 protein [bacterium]
MKVLFWTQQYWPYIGGVEVLSRQFIADMRTRGVEFSVITGHGNLDLPDEDEVDGVPVHRFGFLQALATRDAREILRIRQRVAALKRRIEPDLVHFNLTDPSLFFHLQTASASVPSLVAIRLALPPTAADEKTLLGQALENSAWVTANSGAILEDLHHIAPYTKERSSLVYNGYPMPFTAPTELSFELPKLVCIGRLVEEKGFDLAIKALARLLPDFPELRLTIAGDGSARRDLEALAQELGVSDLVDFVGWVNPEDMPQLLNTATIVVMPSRWREAFGLVALQAAQMARPIVATRVGGLPEVVRHGETGLVVEPESPEALVEGIRQLLGNPDGTRAMGQRARLWAQRQFGWERYVDEYQQLYTRLIQEAKSL